MNNCKKTKPKLVSLVLNGLDEKNKEDCRLHLDKCQSCKNYYDQLSKTINELKTYGLENVQNIQAQENLEFALLQKIEQEKIQQRTFDIFALLRMFYKPAMAFAVLSIIVASTYYYLYISKEIGVYGNIILKSGDVIKTNKSQIQKFELFTDGGESLEAGKEIIVNQNTTVKLKNQNEIYLETGEIYVKVHKLNVAGRNLSSKFQVSTYIGNITVTGTEFNIKVECPTDGSQILYKSRDSSPDAQNDNMTRGHSERSEESAKVEGKEETRKILTVTVVTGTVIFANQSVKQDISKGMQMISDNKDEIEAVKEVDINSIVAWVQEASLQEPGNIVKNSGGEQGIEWWSKYENSPSEYGVTDKEAHSGKKCIYLKLIDALADDGKYNSALVAGRCDGKTGKEAYEVKPNTKYYYSFWLKGKGVFARPFYIFCWGFDKDGNNRDRTGIIIKELTENVIKSEWRQYKGYFTTTEKTERIGFMVRCYGWLGQIEKGAIIYLDDVYIGEQELK